MLQLRYLSAADVAQLAVPRAEILRAVEEALRAQGLSQAVLEPRVHLIPGRAQAGPPGVAATGHFNVLRGHLEPLRVSGVKVVGDFPGNHRRGLPSELGLVTLYDPQTGAPRAIVDATELTAARTGAMTALGARYLARRDARVLGHIGARGSAWWNVRFLADLFDLDEVRVTSRRAASSEALARRLRRELGIPVRAVPTPAAALIGADLMVEASRLTAPAVLVRTAWVAPGTLLVPYGTVSAVEPGISAAMDKVVVDDWAQAAAGPFGALRRDVDDGSLTRDRVHAELGTIVAGRAPGRELADERILFWHRGLATTDIAVAALLVARAEAGGVGTVLDYR